MNMTGVHGIWRAIKDAEREPLQRHMIQTFRENTREYLNKRAKVTSKPRSISSKVAYLASDESIVAECQLSGVITMKRVHCLQRQIGSVARPARRHVITDECEMIGPHYRFKPCSTCKNWLDETEFAQARQLLAACGGQWEEVVRVAGAEARRTEAA